ncbi:hypothetical protein ScPMuIL_008311 [Solemya velum]
MARGKTERLAVPAMPMGVAILCCVLNILLPGIGTMVAGLSPFCCARNEDMGCGERCGSCYIGFLIGFLQLILVPLLFIGWIWSIIWGISFIGMSGEYYRDTTMSGVVISTPVTVISNPPPPPQNISPPFPQYPAQTRYTQYPPDPRTGYPIPEYDPPPPYTVEPSAPFKPD